MKKIALLAALQIGVIVGWAGYHEGLRANAPTFRIPLQPVDPYDVLRGRYFTLNPLDGRIDSAALGPTGTASVDAMADGQQHLARPARVGFCPAGDVFRVCALRAVGDPDHGGATYWARGYLTGSRTPGGWQLSLDLHLDRFFLPNRFQLPGRERDPAWELEVSHRPEQPLLPRRLWFEGRAVEIGG